MIKTAPVVTQRFLKQLNQFGKKISFLARSFDWFSAVAGAASWPQSKMTEKNKKHPSLWPIQTMIDLT